MQYRSNRESGCGAEATAKAVAVQQKPGGQGTSPATSTGALATAIEPWRCFLWARCVGTRCAQCGGRAHAG